MFVERLPDEPDNETCKRCVERYQELIPYKNFDYSVCLRCPLSQEIHKEDSHNWNGFCRYLR